MDKEYDIEKVVASIDFSANSLVNIGRGIMLSVREVEVLEKYSIDYKSCISLEEILFRVETAIFENRDIAELEEVSQTIAERNYYCNTNK